MSLDELQRALWRGGSLVDFEHGLNVAVKRLPAALGDAERPHDVETVPYQAFLDENTLSMLRHQTGSARSFSGGFACPGTTNSQ